MNDLKFAKFILLVNSLVPGSLLLWDAFHGHAGANPVNYAIRTTGILALIFLSLMLLITPLRKISGLNWLFHFRRQLGLCAFFYALAHFGIFFALDRSLSIPNTFSEMVNRPYLVVGSLGLLVMVPLAITSTNTMIKRLGPKRWRMLHRLAYVAAIAGVGHFYMLVKSDTRLPITFGIVVGILLGLRVVLFFWERHLAKFPAVVRSPVDRWNGELRVKQIVQETPNVRTFCLVSRDGGALPFVYLPGQYLTLSLRINGKVVRRSCTISSPPTKVGYCEVTIKRKENGQVSRHIHDVIKEGDIVTVSAPAGRFTFTGTNQTSVALLSAGVGITPLMSILRYLTDQKWSGQIYLVYSNRTVSDIIFRKEIELLQSRHPNLHVLMTLTRADESNWNGAHGRINATLLGRLIPDLKSIPYYLCGPSEMLASTCDLLQTIGVPKSNIHTESFGSNRSELPRNDDSASIAEYTVTFSKSHQIAKIDSNQPILALAEKLGIQADSECRSGICGRCKCRLISGSVRMEAQDALNTLDHQNHFILLCQAQALEDVTVEV